MTTLCLLSRCWWILFFTRNIKWHQRENPPALWPNLLGGGAVFFKDNFKAQRGSRPIRERQWQSCQPTRAAGERNRNLLTAVIRLQFCSLRATLGGCGLPLACLPLALISSRTFLCKHFQGQPTTLMLFSEDARVSGQSEHNGAGIYWYL